MKGGVKEIENHVTRVFGPTCESYDTLGDCALPKELEIGDWIFLPNMDAYSSAGKVDFNGICGASSFG